MSLIAVVMKAPSTKARFGDSQKLLDYGFKNFSFKKLASKGNTVQTVTVTKGIEANIEAITSEDYGTLIQKGKDKDIAQEVSIYPDLVAPISKGQKIGEIQYKSEGNIIGKVDLLSNKQVDKINLLSMSSKIFNTWFTLLRS